MDSLPFIIAFKVRFIVQRRCYYKTIKKGGTIQMKYMDEKSELEFVEIAINSSGLRERNLPPEVFDKIVEHLKTVYVPLMERLAMEIVKKLDDGVPVENIVEEARKLKIEILNDEHVIMLYRYCPPQRDPFEMIISRSGLGRQIMDRDIPFDIIDETVRILKTMYTPLRERLAKRIAEKLKKGLPIENLIEEARKLKKEMLIDEKEKRLYESLNKKSINHERTNLIRWLLANVSRDTADEIVHLIKPFVKEEQRFKGQKAAEEFACRVFEITNKDLSECELVAEARKIQEDIIKKKAITF